MNYQFRGYWVSFIIHSVLLLIVLSLNSSMLRLSKPLIIDFSLEDSSAKGGPRAAPAPESRRERTTQSEQIKPAPASAKQEPTPQKAVPNQVSATSETAAESQAPASASRPSSNVQPASGGSSAAGRSVASEEGKPSAAHGQGSSGEAMKQNYLKEHFSYIRTIVQKNLSYPKIARKMGWQGKVIISFIVCIDGHVRDIAIKEGSGIEMLDKNAVIAVQHASPFPKPPVEARLIIPINYSLD